MMKLYRTGLQAYAFYGSDVVGLDPSQLKTARADYLSLVGSPARSRSLALALTAARDPLWRQALGPVLTWASIIWKSAHFSEFQSFMDLPRLGQLAGPVVEALPSTWNHVRGPLGAAHLSLKRIGWKFLTPMKLLSDKGVEFVLPSTSPALLSYHLQVAWKQHLGTSAAKVVGAPPGTQVDMAIYHSTLPPFPPYHRTLLRAFVMQAVWSNSSLRPVGYDVLP